MGARADRPLVRSGPTPLLHCADAPPGPVCLAAIAVLPTGQEPRPAEVATLTSRPMHPRPAPHVAGLCLLPRAHWSCPSVQEVRNLPARDTHEALLDLVRWLEGIPEVLAQVPNIWARTPLVCFRDLPEGPPPPH